MTQPKNKNPQAPSAPRGNPAADPQGIAAQQPGGAGAPGTGTPVERTEPAGLGSQNEEPKPVPGNANTPGGALNTQPGAEHHAQASNE